jgi:hypothetical protein
MILPTKRISADKALIGLGARVLRQLHHPQTVSRLWETIQRDSGASVSYDWFVLSLDLLYLIGAVEYHDGRLRKVNR